MSDASPSPRAGGAQVLQALVTGFLALAVAYRQGQVTFDIPPARGELLALIAIALWVVCAWRLGGGANVLEWAIGGGLVGLLLAPHAAMLAGVVWAGCGVLALYLLAADWRRAVSLLQTLAKRRPAVLLALCALIGFGIGGSGDWIGLVCLAASAGRLVWQSGRHLWLWSEGRARIR